MYCSRCGKKVLDSMLYCPFCGAEIIIPEQEPYDGAAEPEPVCGRKEKDWGQYSPLALAYLGDAVFDTMIRTRLLKEANCPPHKLHQKASGIVNARSQSRMIQYLREDLTPQEFAIYRRGRNSKPYTKAKNATLEEYLEATGFEALLGFLYLDGQVERLRELVEKGLDELSG